MGNLCSTPSPVRGVRNRHKTTPPRRTSIVSDPNPRYLPELQPKYAVLIRPEEPSGRIVVAQYSYEASDENVISFQIGDKMKVLDDSDDDWWKVYHLTTKTTGYVPANFVAEESSMQRNDWFMENVSRQEAEKLLMNSDNPRGTFLVRPSKHTPGGYSLSVKDEDEQKVYSVKHYKIQTLDNGRFYISKNKTYNSLSALVEAYFKDPSGLCCALLKPCAKPQPQVWDLTPTYKDKWEIPRDEIKLGRVLGTGQFGKVYLGKWKNTKYVAVKTVKEGTMTTSAFLKEAAIMKKFRHNHLVALYGVCSKDDPIYIVQEYMEKGSLLDFLREGERKSLPVGDLIYIAAQVASGMSYLERQQLIHRDLAARNVLIGENNNAKISDFGLARIVDNDQYQLSSDTRLATKWTAPECFIEGIFSTKSDVWSYGILLMELFTYGTIPYGDMTPQQVKISVAKGYRMPKPDMVTDEVYTTALECWNAKPEKRPTFENLTYYFEDYDVSTERQYKEEIKINVG